MLLEICAGSLHSALAAQAGGAHRIELCDNLSEGGTTPPLGTIRQAIRLLNIPVFVIIRPRAGDFLYSDKEFESMKDDIRFCKEQRAKGIVLGILKENGSVDMDRTTDLVQLARPLLVTFHRAFDLARDPFQAMEDVISMGIERILTSGQEATAQRGAPLISELVKKSEGRIIIMPGSGINENNVLEVAKLTGAREIHASLRGPVKSNMKFQRVGAKMGGADTDEYLRLETDPDKVRRVIQMLQNPSL
jgi:copper homeostasis protein